MRRVLLMMTTRTYRASAFMEAASRIGAPIVVGSDRPQILASANPSGHLTVDFGDPEAAADTIVRFARLHPIGAVVAADDEGTLPAALAAEVLGLRHSPPAAVAAARDKHRMRGVLRAAGQRTPPFDRFDASVDPEEITLRVGYPCVLKPLSLSASRGVIRADDPGQFVKAFRRVEAIVSNAAERGILVEGYIPGIEVALEGILVEGDLRVLALFDKPDPLEGPFFEETIYVTPSRHPRPAQEAIVEATRDAVRAIGLTDGPIHAELRVNDAGAWLLEVAPRSIGGLCSRALRFRGGDRLEDLILKHALELPIVSWDREARAAGVMMIPVPRAGILRGVTGRRAALEVPGIEDLIVTIPAGERIEPAPEGSRYLGFLFARAEEPAGVESALRKAHSRLVVAVDPPDRGDAERVVDSEPPGE